MIKRIILIVLMISAYSFVMAQDGRKPATFNMIISDTRADPETRVLACVREGEYYINRFKGATGIDSAAFALSRGRLLSRQLKVYSADGELYFLAGMISRRKGLTSEGKRLNGQALTLLRKKPASGFLGRALLEQGDYLNTDFDYQLNQKIALLNEALGCFKKPVYLQIRASVLKQLGDLYQLDTQTPGNIGHALEAYQRSKDAYFSYGYKSVQDIYIEIASLYRYLGDNKEGLNYCLKAVQTAERAGDTSSLTTCEIYNYTGIQYQTLLDWNNAIKYFKLAFGLAEKFKNERDIFEIAPYLDLCYSHTKEYARAKHLIDHIHGLFPKNDYQNLYYSTTFYLKYYIRIKNLQEGQKYCSNLIRLMENANPSILRFIGRQSYYTISEYYTMARDFAGSYKFWEKAYATMLRYDNTAANRNDLFYAHYRIDTASHNLGSGISYLQQYSMLRDSIYTTDKARQEADLKVLFDTQKSDYELAESRQKIQILTKNGQLQRAYLSQAVLTRNITIGFIFVLIIAGGVLARLAFLYKTGIGKIEKVVAEKEWLLREIHHRVKNNLHTVMCLLESQSTYLEKEALKAIEDSRQRIYAISLVHQKLYENDDMKTIDMRDYISSLVCYLQDCFDLKDKITFKLDIEHIWIETSVATPICLIINEVVTNSIKYAFPGGGPGLIEVTLKKKDDQIMFVVRDNGIGIDIGVLNKPMQSMGIRLIKGLCGDIGGVVTFSNNPGTEVCVVCPETLIDDESIDIEALINLIPDYNSNHSC